MTKQELENYEPKGQLKGFPEEIIAKMLYYQEEQGNQINVSIFEGDRCNIVEMGGFDWYLTKEGHEFWCEVIYNKNFKHFFEKYPKQDVHSECKKQEHQESKNAKHVQVGDNAILSDITSTQSSVETEINTTEENPQEFRVGDKVYDILLQEVGVVQDILHSSSIPYGLSVEFKSRVKLYTLNGCDFEYKNPQLLHYKDDYDYSVIDFNNLPKRQEPKKWRAKKGGIYYAITAPAFKIGNYFDDYVDSDNEVFEIGNYFQTEEQAQEVADKLKEYFKQLIK